MMELNFAGSFWSFFTTGGIMYCAFNSKLFKLSELLFGVF